jgi:hypothetical protein
MKILIIDLYNYPRDLAQMDMYTALSEKFDIILANPENIINYIYEDDYDYLYLGIYHPWCGVVNWDEIFKINKKPIIIDQADNEGFMARKDSKLFYGDNCVLLSRYLPNRIEQFWNGKLFLLPWYINPDRFIPQEKTIDLAFVCTININRIGNDRKVMSENILKYSKENNLNSIIGQYYGDNYRKIITSSKAMIIDGSRYCMTQKYIEAALSECIIIGESPTSPPNKLITYNIEEVNIKNIDLYKSDIKFNKNYILNNFANKEVFINNFSKIIK